jgi:nitroreductase
MDFGEVVRTRSSVRDYDPARPVPRAVLDRILEAGRLAPSACDRQPWRFLVISSPEGLARVRRCYAQPWLKDAPQLLTVTGSVKAAWTRKADGWNSLETDLAIAMDHLVLAATSEGVGTCWIAAFQPDILRTALGLGADQRVFAITPLGYPRGGPGIGKLKERKTIDQVVEFR